MNSYDLIFDSFDGKISEVLTDIDFGSFKYEYEQNSTRTISFSIVKTTRNADIFDNIQNEGIIRYKGQQYVIKELSLSFNNVSIMKDISAHHIMFEFQNHYIDKDLENEQLNSDTSEEVIPRYTLKQILDFGFRENVLGYKYKIVGSFPDAKPIPDELGDENGIEYLVKHAETFNYIMFGVNKTIYIYNPKDFYIESGVIIRERMNSESVASSVSTKDMRTWAIGYGKKKTKSETKNYNPIKTPSITLKGKFTKTGTWRTEQKGASYEVNVDCKWGNETLDFNFKKGPNGGLWEFYLDDNKFLTASGWYRTMTTEKITVGKNLSRGRHTFKAVFLGPNPDLDYKDFKPVGYIGTEKAIILNVTAVLSGDDLYHYKYEYKSPNFKNFPNKKAKTIYEDNAKDKQELIEKVKAEILDEPVVEFSTNYIGSDVLNERNTVHLKHEPLNFDTELKIVKFTEYHPILNKHVDVEFSNAKQDIVDIQQAINNSILKTGRTGGPSQSDNRITAVSVGSV